MNVKEHDVGLICGRFQTFHLGHERLVNVGLKLCDRVVIMIGSSQESGTERNPFNVTTREKMIRTVYGNDERLLIYGIPDLTNENDIRPEWGRYLLDHVDQHVFKAPELMIYGNDEARSKWFDPKDIIDTSEYIINRGKLNISATMVREAMMLDDRRKWMEMVNPRLHKMYDELRRELMNIPFYKDQLQKLLSKKYSNSCEAMYMDN